MLVAFTARKMADQNESVQQRIQIARRDAEALKDRIKRKKDELADTTRESMPHTKYCIAFAVAVRVDKTADKCSHSP